METQTPPPFNPQVGYGPPPQKKSSVGLIIGIILGVCALCCGGCLIFGISTAKKYMPFITCTINGSVARKAIMLYVDRTGKFPDAGTWQDEIASDFSAASETDKSNQGGPFKVWSASDDWICSPDSPQTGLAYNEDLAGKKLTDIKDTYHTMLLFEVPGSGRNLHQKFVSRPPSSWPKANGNPRPWVELTISGNTSASYNVNTDSKDSDD